MRNKAKRPEYPRKKALILTQATTKAKINVRLDHRTTITLPDMSALKLWIDRYPNAKVVDNF